jgi:hypothetical protein
LSYARRLSVAVVATCLFAALAVAPTAFAAGGSGSKSGPTAKAAISKKKINRKVNRVSKRVTKVGKRVTKAENRLKTAAKAIAAVGQLAKGADDKANRILAVAPQIVNGLTALRDASLQLKAGLQALAAGTQRLGQFATSQEYGWVAMYTQRPGAANPCCRSTPVMSPDIPDSGNTASASGELPISVSPAAPEAGAPNLVLPGTKVSMRAAIKSNEADGGAEGDPAGQVGGLLMVTCAGGGAGGGCGDGPDPNPNDETPENTQPDFPAGTLMCLVGPTQKNRFQTPAGPTDQQLVNIQEKQGFTESPTNFDFEFGPGLVNPLANAQTQAGTGNKTEGTCLLPSNGAYLVKLQTQFVDIPTSADPGPRD